MGNETTKLVSGDCLEAFKNGLTASLKFLRDDESLIKNSNPNRKYSCFFLQEDYEMKIDMTSKLTIKLEKCYSSDDTTCESDEKILKWM